MANGGNIMRNRGTWPTCTVFVNLAVFVALCPNAWAQQMLPDAFLRVTVQQKQEGKLNPAMHVQHLRCWRGECSLTSVTLNDCRPFPSGGSASPLIIERSSTREGNLTVTKEGNTLVVVEIGSDIGGGYVTTQRFKYENPRDGGIVRRLVGYSGGFVKDSVVGQKVITADFLPLQGTLKQAQLDCALALPGVDVLN